MSDQSKLDDFLSEFNASLSQDTQEAFLRRVTAEGAIKLIFEELLDQHKATNIRILADRQLNTTTAADYLVQVDDYDLRLILLDAPDGKPNLTDKLLLEWKSLLEANPSTTAVIIIWTSDDLLSIALTMRRIRYLIENPDEVAKLPRFVESFYHVISDVIRRQTKGWNIPDVKEAGASVASRDLFAIFSEKIGQAIDSEANRRYRTEERLLAAKQFPYEQEKRVLLNTLRAALDGASAQELVRRVTILPRRGEP
jgi:hypothetical protein